MSPANSETTAELADRLAIERLLVRYCTLIDSKDFARLGEVFTPDAVVDYTSAGGIRGTLAEIQAWLGKALAPFTVVQHHVTNFDVRLDGDRAESTCSLFNPMGMPDADGALNMFWCGGRYRDELVRTPSGWRIRRRINELSYMQGAPRSVRSAG